MARQGFSNNTKGSNIELFVVSAATSWHGIAGKSGITQGTHKCHAGTVKIFMFVGGEGFHVLLSPGV